MIPFAFGVVVSLLIGQAAVNAPREAFTACLKTAVASAEAQKVAPAQFSAHLMTMCAAQAGRFKDALVSFDVKNGIKRAQATADAQLQLDDYLAMSAEKYQAKHASAN